MEKINIWIDCDPGIDDAVMLAMASASRDKLNILGISTVAGNQTIETVTENALRLADFLGLSDVPVVKGAKGPLTRAKSDASDVHGKNGIGNVELPKPAKTPDSLNAVPYMRDVIMALPEDEKITLVPTGPMTNIALLLKTFPEVEEKIEKIVLMGGSTAEGNVTMTAEFNIWADPEAGKIVYDSNLPIAMFGLDVTNKCGLYRSQVAEMTKSENKVESALGQMIDYYFKSPAYVDRDMTCLHDAATILYLTDPELFDGFYGPITVDCGEELNRGCTICDRRKTTHYTENRIMVFNQVDLEKFQKTLFDKLAFFA